MAEWETVKIRNQDFAVMQCGSCGVIFVVPLIVHQHHFDNGGFAHCSNGHSLGWEEGNTEREAVRRERDRLKQENARLEDEKKEWIATANAQLDRARQAESKLKVQSARIGAGVCPCCNRTVSQLARHMQSKHPDVPFVRPAKKARA